MKYSNLSLIVAIFATIVAAMTVWQAYVQKTNKGAWEFAIGLTVIATWAWVHYLKFR